MSHRMHQKQSQIDGNAKKYKIFSLWIWILFCRHWSLFQVVMCLSITMYLPVSVLVYPNISMCQWTTAEEWQQQVSNIDQIWWALVSDRWDTGQWSWSPTLCSSHCSSLSSLLRIPEMMVNVDQETLLRVADQPSVITCKYFFVNVTVRWLFVSSPPFPTCCQTNGHCGWDCDDVPPEPAAPVRPSLVLEDSVRQPVVSDSGVVGGVRDDGRCGAEFDNAGCDPDSQYFCCSAHGYCGGTGEHCSCDTCINYRPSSFSGEVKIWSMKIFVNIASRRFISADSVWSCEIWQKMWTRISSRWWWSKSMWRKQRGKIISS